MRMLEKKTKIQSARHCVQEGMLRSERRGKKKYRSNAKKERNPFLLKPPAEKKKWKKITEKKLIFS